MANNLNIRGKTMNREWSDFCTAYNDFIDNLDFNDKAYEKWNILVLISKDMPYPNHLVHLIKYLECESNYNVLDHGCGGAINVIYLLCLGYKNIKGVDLNHKKQRFLAINSFLTRNKIVSNDILSTYTGVSTGFDDNCFNVIFSTQVVEHLSDQDFDGFFEEENRILGEHGVLFHEFPHKNTIYDGHLNTYLLHMLPDGVLTSTLKLFGNKRYVRINKDLFLRSIRKINKRIKQHFKVVIDLTSERLLLNTDYSTYKGNKKLRKIVGYMLKVSVFRKLISVFSVKTIKIYN